MTRHSGSRGERVLDLVKAWLSVRWDAGSPGLGRPHEHEGERAGAACVGQRVRKPALRMRSVAERLRWHPQANGFQAGLRQSCLRASRLSGARPCSANSILGSSSARYLIAGSDPPLPIDRRNQL